VRKLIVLHQKTRANVKKGNAKRKTSCTPQTASCLNIFYYRFVAFVSFQLLSYYYTPKPEAPPQTALQNTRLFNNSQ